MACMIAIAVSIFGAMADREAMTAMIDRDQRHWSMALDCCSEGCVPGSRNGIASGSASALHLVPRGPDVSRSSTWGGSNLSCCRACL